MLSIVYYLLVVPCGLIVRLVSGDPLHRRLQPEWNSYFVTLDGTPAREAA